MPSIYEFNNYIIVTGQVLTAPVHNCWFYWMILCLIFAKGNYRSIPCLIISLHWFLRSLSNIVDQLPYYSLIGDNQITREMSWKKIDSFVITFNYMAEIVGDWYPVYKIYSLSPSISNILTTKIVACVCVFFNITKLLPVVHFHFNFDFCDKLITFNIKKKCIHTDFWVHWSTLQYIIALGTIIYYLLCFIIIKRNGNGNYKRNSQNISVFKKFRILSQYRIQVECILSIIAALTVIPIGFQTKGKINFNFELLRDLLNSFSYYIIYFDRILLSDSIESEYVNSENDKLMKHNNLFKANQLNLEKSNQLFTSNSMEDSYNCLSTKDRDYFIFSNAEISNQKGISSFNPNRISGDFIHPYQDDINLINNDQYFILSPSANAEPLLFTQNNTCGNTSKVAGLRNPMLDSARINGEFIYDPNGYLEEDINDIQLINEYEQYDAFNPEYPTNLTLPPFRTQKDDINSKDNNKKTVDGISVYSKSSHARTVSKGSFYFGNLPTPKIKRVSAKSLGSFLEANRMSISAASLNLNVNRNNSRKSNINFNNNRLSFILRNNSGDNSIPSIPYPLSVSHKNSNDAFMKAESPSPSPLSLFNRSNFSPYIYTERSPVDKSFDKSLLDKSFDKSPVDKSFDKSLVDKSFDKSQSLLDKSFDKSQSLLDKSFDKSLSLVDKSFDKSLADKSFDKSLVDKSFDKSLADKSFDKSQVDRSFNKSQADKSFNKSFDSSLINGEDIANNINTINIIVSNMSSLNVNTSTSNFTKENNL